MTYKKLLLIGTLLGGMVMDAQASTINIDDLTDSLRLFVDGTTVTVNIGDGTHPGDIQGYSNTVVGTKETLTFTFTSAVASAGNFDAYLQLVSEEDKIGLPQNPQGLSDLFYIHEVNGSNLDVVTFISSDNPADLAPPNGYTAQPITPRQPTSPLPESGQYQIVYQTFLGAGTNNPIDTYQVRSDVVPEPATLTLLGFGLAGMVARRRLSKRK